MVIVSKPINIESRQVLQDMGYHADVKPPAGITSLVDDYIENVYQLVEPTYSYVIRDIELVYGSGVVIEGWITFGSEVVARLLERCEKVVVFVVTIGNYLEEMVGQLAEDGMILQATVLDAIGSAAVENLASFMQDRIRAIALAEGLYTSRRFSPGYCDWDVAQQRMVFQVMNWDTAGVSLTEGCLMLPRKSLSGIIGLGPPGVENYDPCHTCDTHDCPGRR